MTRRERRTCTAAAPRREGDEGPWEHPDAKYVDQEDGWPGGDLAVYDCPHCGLRFKVELPQ